MWEQYEKQWPKKSKGTKPSTCFKWPRIQPCFCQTYHQLGMMASVFDWRALNSLWSGRSWIRPIVSWTSWTCGVSVREEFWSHLWSCWVWVALWGPTENPSVLHRSLTERASHPLLMHEEWGVTWCNSRSSGPHTAASFDQWNGSVVKTLWSTGPFPQRCERVPDTQRQFYDNWSTVICNAKSLDPRTSNKGLFISS